MEQLEWAVEEGLLPPVNLTENQRLIIDRQASLVRAERGLQEAAIKLSLYWRDEEGRPSVPAEGALPYDFPAPRPAVDVLVRGDEEFALEQRPEVRAIALELESLRLKQSMARNTFLPELDFGMFASQDVGAPVNDPDDKGEFELEALLSLNVPLQRRGARGKVREITGKLSKLEREAQFVREVVVTDVQDARSALVQSWLRIEQSRENVRLANELAEIERFQLREGESDLLRVNLREQQAAVAAAKLVDDLHEYFRALAVYRAVLGIPYEASNRARDSRFP
jgi:outer membrane protein TolC